MTRRRKRLLIAGSLVVLTLITGFAFRSSHRVASFARHYLALDLSAIPFGSSPSAIPGVAPYVGTIPSDQRALAWYSTIPEGPTTPELLYGFSGGRLTEIRVTRWTPDSDYRFSRGLFLYSMSPRVFSALRRTGQFRFSDSSSSLHFSGGCDPLRPMLSFFTITPNSQ